MRTRIVTSAMMAAAAVAVLGLSVPAAFAVDEAVSSTDTVETVGQATGEEDATTSTLDQVADEIDATVAAAEEEVDGTASEGPEPVAEAADATTDAAGDTTDAVTDAIQQTADEPTDPDGSDGEDGKDGKDQRGAGDDPVSAAVPGSETPAPSERALAGRDGATSAPARIALDGFRRTSGGTSTELAVTAEPVFEQEPAFAPPTTREVVEPTVTAAPPLSLRTVAVEILVAAALLVMATGGLVAELGPERT